MVTVDSFEFKSICVWCMHLIEAAKVICSEPSRLRDDDPRVFHLDVQTERGGCYVLVVNDRFIESRDRVARDPRCVHLSDARPSLVCTLPFGIVHRAQI